MTGPHLNLRFISGVFNWGPDAQKIVISMDRPHTPIVHGHPGKEKKMCPAPGVKFIYGSGGKR
jgi:hypothetical protein